MVASDRTLSVSGARDHHLWKLRMDHRRGLGQCGPTAINMMVNQDGYYCVARGIPENPGVGEVGYLLHKGQGLQTGTLKDASLSQVSMACYNYDPGPPDPPLPGGPDGPPPS